MTDQFGKRIHQADRLMTHLENSLNFIAGALVFGLMFLGVIQVFLRVVFRKPMFGYIDIVELSMVGFAVLSISFVQRIGGHVRMEMLISRLRGRANWIFEIFGTLLAIFIVTVLIPYSFKHFQRAYYFGDSTIDIELSTWPAKLIVPVALGILLVRLFIQLAGYVRLTINPGLAPVGVPLVKNVAEQADEEIMHAEEDISEAHFSQAEKGEE